MSSRQPSPATSTDATDPAAAPRRSRWTWAVAALAVVAMLSPVGWLVSRPAPDAGLPLTEALADGPAAPGTTTADGSAPSSLVPRSPAAADGPAEPGAAATGERAGAPAREQPDAAGPGPYGEVVVRDASVAALAAEAPPAPDRLVVPGMGIDAPVDGVGVEADGSMVIPDDVARVGWYRFGAGPGAAAGNTVLAGHVDGADQGPGVLFELRGVEVGTRLSLVDDAGTEHVYEVVGRESITKAVLPVDRIFDRDGEHRLVIITCGGEFQPELRSYTDNVVVTAVPVEQG